MSFSTTNIAFDLTRVKVADDNVRACNTAVTGTQLCFPSGLILTT